MCGFAETLRLHTLVPMLTRTCAQDYKIPGTKQIIEKGVEVYVPVYAMQRDPQYYDEPMKFDPERFNEDNLATTNHTDKPFMPFGIGPRHCIAQRLGRLQTKVALFTMLQKFRFELTDKDKGREIKLDRKAFIPIPRETVFLHVYKR